MTLDDFLEHFYARLSQYESGLDDGRTEIHSSVFPSAGAVRTFLRYVGSAHVFYLGDESGIDQSLREIGADVAQDLRRGLPMPFSNMAMVWKTDEGEWFLEWLVKSSRPQPENTEFFCYADFHERHLARKEIQIPVFFQNVYTPGRLPRTDLYPGHFVDPDAPTQPPRRGDVGFGKDAVQPLIECLDAMFHRVAAISHPALYVVRSTPTLTPREARQAQRSGGPPARKRPRYVVVDYTGLQELRSRPTGPVGLAPVPHERRGHWRRLAEQCVHARASGRDRVWVRPTVVGDLQFEDERARYEVILNPTPPGAHDGVPQALGGSGRERLARS